MNITKAQQVHEGKAKKVFATSDENLFIIDFKDDATAFNGVKKDVIADKGIVNNRISTLLFKELKKHGVNSHFIEQLSEREMLVKKLDILQLEVILRNICTGSIVKRLGIEEGKVLNPPLIEFCYKNDDYGDPVITEDHIRIMDLATPEQLKEVRRMTGIVNDVMGKLFNDMGITLVDFKLEFGLHNGEVLLGDEISPDSCRLWDKATGEKLDKDIFRQGLGDLMTGYNKVLAKLEENNQ